MGRRGFTLIELLIVMSIIGVLTAVMIPAVQHVREAANRTQCANNLKQIATAFHAFHIVHNELPVGRCDEYGGVTWAVFILPYLDQDPLFSRWDVNRWYYVHSSETRQAHVKTYYCPARRMPGDDAISNQGELPEKGPWSGRSPPFQPPFYGALGDYAVCAGDNRPNYEHYGPTANGAIVLGKPTYFSQSNPYVMKECKSRTRFDTLSDGLGNTLILGEKHVPLGKFGRESEGDGSIYNGDPLNLNAARVAAVNYPIARLPDEPFKMNFGSYHPKMCHFITGDGGLRPIPTTVHGSVLAALAVRNDGRVVKFDY